MKILVTGGAGFIASNLADELIKYDHEVVVIDNLSTGSKKNLNPKSKFYKIDICDKTVSKIFEKEKPEIVFHYAAQIDVRKSVDDPVEDAKVNILGSINILENCRKNRVEKIIFSSTGGAIYGEAEVVPTPETYQENPLSPYGIGKLSVEKYLNYYHKNFGLSFISLRFANVYGPRQNSKGEAGVVAIFCEKMLSGHQLVINGDGKQTRDFVYVEDVVNAGVVAILSPETGRFNIGTGQQTSVNNIFDELKELTGYNCKKVYSPPKTGEQKRSCLDYSKAAKELEWQPKYNLKQGLTKTVEWFNKK